MSHYLAFDLGAESGRAMLGKLSGGRLEFEGIAPLSEPTGAAAGWAVLGRASAVSRDPRGAAAWPDAGAG